MSEIKTKTHFKGPGEWRSQAAQLESTDKVKGDAPIKPRASR